MLWHSAGCAARLSKILQKKDYGLFSSGAFLIMFIVFSANFKVDAKTPACKSALAEWVAWADKVMWADVDRKCCLIYIEA